MLRQALRKNTADAEYYCGFGAFGVDMAGQGKIPARSFSIKLLSPAPSHRRRQLLHNAKWIRPPQP